jgi:hypothetical protein
MSNDNSPPLPPGPSEGLKRWWALAHALVIARTARALDDATEAAWTQAMYDCRADMTEDEQHMLDEVSE